MTDDTLTTREMRVLRLIADGLTDGEIGKRLYVSERTVKTAVGRVFCLLGARNRAHAVRLALTTGMLVIEPVDKHAEVTAACNTLRSTLRSAGPVDLDVDALAGTAADLVGCLAHSAKANGAVGGGRHG